MIITIDWTTAKKIQAAKGTPFYYAQLKPQLEVFIWDEVRGLAYACTLGFESEGYNDFEVNFKDTAIQVTSLNDGIALKLAGVP